MLQLTVFIDNSFLEVSVSPCSDVHYKMMDSLFFKFILSNINIILFSENNPVDGAVAVEHITKHYRVHSVQHMVLQQAVKSCMLQRPPFHCGLV